MNAVPEEVYQAEMAGIFASTARDIMQEHCRPFVLHRPRVYRDGNAWCCLLGANIQEGVAGFGDSPEAASRDFDRNWVESVNAGTEPTSADELAASEKYANDLVLACESFRDQVLHGIDQFEPHQTNAVLDLFDNVIGGKL